MPRAVHPCYTTRMNQHNNERERRLPVCPAVPELLRLNQAIAKSGFCSRRAADRFITLGKVTVNKKVVRDFNFKVNPVCDQLAVSGRSISIKQFICIAMYKPAGIVTSLKDERGRKNIMDLFPEALRHIRPVGRLDKNSEGLILLTNDGQLTQQVTHPTHHLSKCYLVTVKGRLTDSELKQLSNGIKLEDGFTLPASVKLKKYDNASTNFEIVLKEGRNRQIRRMCTALGYPVIRLVRVAIGGLKLGQMLPGSWRYLRNSEIQDIYK